MADFSTMWQGLLDAHDGIVNPRAPAGAGYTDQTARMAQAALLGNLGATLLAAGQGGQSFDQRARILAGLGNASNVSAQILQNGTVRPPTDEDRARTAHLQMQTEQLRSDQERMRKAQEWLTTRDGPAAVPAPAAPTTTSSGPPTPGKVAAGPALPDISGTVPPASSPAPGAVPPVPGVPAAPGAPGAAPPVSTPQPTPPAQPGVTPFKFPREQVQQMLAAGIKPEEIIKLEVEESLKRSKPQQLNPDQVLSSEGELRKEFTGNEAIKGFNEAQRQYTQMQNIVKAANSGQPGAGVNDTALVYAFFKTIDPTSTVREGEFATVGANMGLPAQVVAALQKIDGKGFLTPETRKELANVAEGYLFRRYEDVDRLGGDYRRIAQSRGLSPDNIVVDPRSPETKGRYVANKLSPDMIMGAGNEELKQLVQLKPYLKTEQLLALRQRLQMLQPGRFGGGN